MLVGEVFARMGLDSKQYEKDLSRLEGVTRREATTLGAVFKNAFSVALGIGVFEAVKRGFQTIASTAISFNAMTEQARIGFTTMLGSAERADKFLRDVADFAARTPFEFPELLDAAKRMLAYGFAAENVLPTMEAVGNASAAVGLGAQGINRIILALGQIRAKGKLSAEEMRQLTETGIPAWEMLADAMGKTTAEIMDMQQKGLIPAHDAIQMIIEGMNKRFPGMMKKMENTWEGVTSTIKDVWRMTIGTMTAGLFDGLKTWLQGVRDWAVDFYDIFREQGLQAALTHSFGAEFASAVSLASSVLRGFFNVLKYVVGLVRRHWQLIKYTGMAMLVYTAATKTASAATAVFQAITLALNGQLTAKIPLLSLVSTAMGIYRVQMALAAAQGIVLTGALAKLRVALYAVHTALGPIGWALLGLSLLVAGGMALWEKYKASLTKTQASAEKTKQALEGLNKTIGDQSDAFKELKKQASKSLQSFDEIHTLQKDMAGEGEDLLDGFDFGDLDTGFDISALDVEDILTELEGVKPTFRGFLEYLCTEADKVLRTKWGPLVAGLFVSPVAGAIVAIKNNWDKIKEWASNLWEGVKEKWGAFTDWVSGIWGKVVENWNAVLNWFSSLPGQIGAFLSEAGVRLQKFFIEDAPYWVGYAVGKLLRFFVDLPGNVWKQLTILAGKLAEWAPIVWNWASETGSKLVTGFIDWVKKLPGNLWAWLVNTAQKIPTWGNQLRTFAIAAANNFVTGAMNVIKNLPSQIWEVLTTAAKKILDIGSNFYNNAKTIAENAWKGFKKGFGISSPSYIERALFAIQETSKQTVADLRYDFSSLGHLQMPKELITMPSALISPPAASGNFSSVGDKLDAIYTATQGAYKAVQPVGAVDRPIEINLYLDRTAFAKVTAKSLKELQRQSGALLMPI